MANLLLEDCRNRVAISLVTQTTKKSRLDQVIETAFVFYEPS